MPSNSNNNKDNNNKDNNNNNKNDNNKVKDIMGNNNNDNRNNGSRFTSKNQAFDITSTSRFKKDSGQPVKVFNEQKKRFDEPASHNVDKTPQVPRFTQDKPKNVYTAPRFS